MRGNWLEALCAFFKDPLQRERERIRAEMAGIHGLVPLLMKQGNGYRWTAVERCRLVHELRTLFALSPYLVALLAPGSFVLIPVVAWWLDRRRQIRCKNQIQPARPLGMFRMSMKSSQWNSTLGQ